MRDRRHGRPPDRLAYDRADLLFALDDLADETILWYAHRLGGPPVLAVRGNHDAAWAFPAPIVDVQARTVEVLGLTLGGIGCSIRYKTHGHHMYDQEDGAFALTGFPRVDVFLAHNSPRGVAERDTRVHVGFDAFAAYVDVVRPPRFLHGPQHADHETRMGATWVVGTYGPPFLELARPGARSHAAGRAPTTPEDGSRLPCPRRPGDRPVGGPVRSGRRRTVRPWDAGRRAGRPRGAYQPWLARQGLTCAAHAAGPRANRTHTRGGSATAKSATGQGHAIGTPAPQASASPATPAVAP